jgi:ribose transport system ATP-binding protein
LLEIRGLDKSYGVPVLTGIDLDIRAGEVHALLGANGAGKSTLARIICGLTPPDAGRMTLGGEPHAPASKRDAERAGIHIIHQELRALDTLSVAENLFLDQLPSRWGVVDQRALQTNARAALELVGLSELDPTTPLGQLGIGRRQLVEIAGALARPCRLLILDEPTAALTAPEIDTLFAHLDRLRREGVGLVYISHRMGEIQRIADRVTVLRDGRLVATRPAAELSPDDAVRLMVGNEWSAATQRARRVAGRMALRVEDLCAGDRVRDVSFEVRQGEILGLSGLVGSGRTETLRALFGADLAERGRVLVGDALAPVQIGAPRDAVRAGIGLIPEDRKAHGLLLARSVRLNVTLGRLATVARRGGWIDRRAERRLAVDLCDRLGVRFASVEQPVAELSGGNQQKVVIARWLARDCDVLLFDEPTRGIDVAAKETVYRLLDELATAGKALVVASSEVEELLALCDRIAVMSAGRIAAVFERGDWTQERIMAAAFSRHLATEGAPA